MNLQSAAQAGPGREEQRPQDPVCGRTITSPRPELSEEYAGVTYVFCSSDCLERFIRDTDIFTLGGPTGAQATRDRGRRDAAETRSYQGPVTFEQSHT